MFAPATTTGGVRGCRREKGKKTHKSLPPPACPLDIRS